MLKYKDIDMGRKIPVYKISTSGPIHEMKLLVKEHQDEMYRIVVEHIMDCIDGNAEEGEPLAIIVDENDNEYDLSLKREAWPDALNKANDYFVEIEEYETCDLIKQLLNIISKQND